MPGPDPNDAAIEALLAGTPQAGAAGLAAFVDDVRVASGAVPTPSPALAAAIAAGGLSVPRAPAAQRPVEAWRNYRMKIKGFVAGLGIAGKLALGVGVAAAATTGAGAAGVLPDPVQHAFSKAVGAVTPFTAPDPGHHDGSGAAAGAGDHDTTTTTVGDATTTTAPARSGDDGSGAVAPPTTVSDHHDGVTDTTVAAPGGHEGDSPTTEKPNDGDHNNPEAIVLHCERASEPLRVVCSWTASPNADHARYVLLRTGDGSGRVVAQTEDGLTRTDDSVEPGHEYEYLVDSLRADGSVDAHSNRVAVEIPAAPATTTTTTEHHEPTTTTTVHPDGGGDGTTTTTAHI